MLRTTGGNLTAFSLAVATGLAVSACGNNPGHPVALPRTSSPPTAPPTLAPTPTASPLSERQAALAVVRGYYRGFNELHRSMDAHALAVLFTASCPCQAQVRSIRAAAARGEHYTDRASINAMRPSVQDGRHAYVLVNLDTARGGLVRSDGTRLTTAAPQQGVQRVFRLVRVGSRWLIARIEAA